MESSHVLLKVTFKKMCLQGCLEDTDCCAGSDVVWKCIPGLCCGYGERLCSPRIFGFGFGANMGSNTLKCI